MSDALWRTYADASQLVSAIVNLCVNSRDAMPDGGNLRVATSNVEFDERDALQQADARVGQFICIAVTDSGSGMSPEVLARAFDPFYTTKPVGQGTGLGLSQVYGFVKQSGGHLHIQSALGGGTTIRIYLPRFIGPDEPIPAEIIGQLSLGLNEEVILVVEDDERVRNMTVEALQGLGYSVIAATGAVDALQGLSTHPIVHLLFTDIVMPGMNGRLLADRVTALRPSVKVLFTTGYSRDAVIDSGTLDRDIAFPAKPFTVEQLAQKTDLGCGSAIVGAVPRHPAVPRPSPPYPMSVACCSLRPAGAGVFGQLKLTNRVPTCSIMPSYSSSSP